MTLSDLNIIIIGAGIGGLAASLVLRRHGASVRVLEQAPAITEVGAGLQISPNGFCVLNALGLSDALRAGAVHGQGVHLHDYRGSSVACLDFALSGHTEYHFVHRADLISLLEQAAHQAGVEIVTDCKMASATPGSQPCVTDMHGHIHTGDLVIGADGLHSVARAALNGTLAPFFTGQVAWRAVVPETDPDCDVSLFMGPKRHIVSYPLRAGTERNIVAVQERRTWVAESWSQRDNPDHLRAQFSDFGPRVRDLLNRVEDVHLWGLFRHPVAPVWHRGNVALLGDAAHPTLPFLAQGGNMALEDAWVLGQCLERADGLEQGLSSYQSMRQSRVTRIVTAASRNAWKYHLSFGPLRFAAHTALRLGGRLAPERMIRQFDWLYGYDVTQLWAVRGRTPPR